MKRRIHPALLAFLLAGLSLALYLPTWSSVETWANFGDDGPELETAGRTMGIPHPTGYPLLMLLVRVVGLAVPPPVSALNVMTLLAAVAAVVAAGACGQALGRTVFAAPKSRTEAAPDPSSASVWLPWASGLLAGSFLALSFTWWKQAVIGEVYTLHLALFTGALALIFTGDRRCRLIAAYLLGLGMAHHLETLPLLAVVLAYLALRRELRPRLSWLANGIAFLAPISLYLVLVIRSRFEPPIDWGNPETLGNLWWSVSGQAYRAHLFREGFTPFIGRWGDSLLHGPVFQLGWGGAALAAVGLAVAIRRARREAAALALLFLDATFVAAAYAIPDPAAYALPAFLALALAAGLGGAWILGRAVEIQRSLGGRPWRLAPTAAAGAFLVASLACRIPTVSREADASGDRAGFLYAKESVESMLPGALVLSHGDGRTFSLWYGAEILSPRPDVTILYDNLLDWSWYRRSIERKHPELALPPADMPLWLRRGALIECYVDKRPVYVTDLDPELLPLFVAEPAGPIFRVARRPDPSARRAEKKQAATRAAVAD